MKQLTVKGNQSFMGKSIPVVSGGFGQGKKCMSDKTISEIHGQPIAEIRKSISRNITRFKESVDFIDLKIVGDEITNNLLVSLSYSQMQISKAEHIYILSERGYSKLIKIMDTDLAWEIHDKLMDEYFEMRDEKQAPLDISTLSPELQMFKQIFDSVAQTQLAQKEQQQAMENMGKRIDGIKEVVALNPNDWRKDTANLINKMALKSGGYEHIKAIREESYELLNKRFGVALGIRLTNKKKTLSLNGVCKSKVDKCNYLDVIGDDKKLIEGYISIVKEMAIRYGACEKAS